MRECVLKPSRRLQNVCYNADTFRNKLLPKGLPVTPARLFRIVRLICALATLAAVGLPVEAVAQTSTQSTTSTPRGSSAPKPKLTLKKKRPTSAAATSRARRVQAARARVAAALREAEEPKFKLNDVGALIPDVRAGYKLPLYDVLHLMLIASDNAAARVLSRSSSLGSSEAFINRMNEKARELGLTSTHYADPSGLLATNVSSAYDMARLIAFVAGDDRISSVMRKQYHTITVGRRTITVHSTNQLVMKGDVDVLGGKTGFISKAGYCLATLLRLPQGGPQVAVVVLGARSNAGRFWETRHLFNWLSSKTQDLFATPVQAAGAGATN